MARGPATRSLDKLRKEGYRAQVVEKYNAFSKRYNDLFGIIDIVAIGHGETLGVQTTSGSNVSSRVKKIEDSEALSDLRESGWRLIVHGWEKKGNRWACREVDIS